MPFFLKIFPPLVLAAGMLSAAETTGPATDAAGPVAVASSTGQAATASRELVLTHRYLHLPVRTGAPKRRMSLRIDGQAHREFEIELAENQPEFWVFEDLDAHRGKTLRIEVDALEHPAESLARISQADQVPDAQGMYHEPHRPQFHFTSRRGWLNDPNGLVYQAGAYHLYYQHNPYGWSWGNMHWGHALSTDLVHWHEQPIALRPRAFGDWCFSGSAVVDTRNTSRSQSGQAPPLAAAFTSTGRGECILFSNDRGQTWKEYEGNPVVKHAGRDPRLLWFEPAKHWVMAVYDETGGKQSIAFYASSDLKAWTYQSKIDGFFECPDLFELPVDGDRSKTRWVLHAADGKYMLGDFDGRAFRPTSGKNKLQLWYGSFYAAQSYSNTPDGRRIQIGWNNAATFPGMPFNQQMTLPVELTLKNTDEGIRLMAQPVLELASLRGQKREWSALTLSNGEDPLRELSGDLFEIALEASTDGVENLGLDLRGTRLVYEPARHELVCKNVRAPLQPYNGKINLRVFLDRGSIEVFGNDGRIAMSVAAIPGGHNRTISVLRQGGPVKIDSLVVHELKSAWGQP